MNNEVPANIRKEFSTAEINTGINNVEKMGYEHINETVYIPESDPRAVNVVQKIKEGVPHHEVEDDYAPMNMVKDINDRVTALETEAE